MEKITISGIVSHDPLVEKNKNYTITSFRVNCSYYEVSYVGVRGEPNNAYCIILPGHDFATITDVLIKNDIVLIKGYLTDAVELVDDEIISTVDGYIIAEEVHILKQPIADK